MKSLDSFLLKSSFGRALALVLIALTLLAPALGAARSQAKKKTAAEPRAAKKIQPRLGTSFRFDGMSLHGKYQSAPWTSTTVEDDKFLEDLLGARKHFRDRVEMDQKRN